MGKAVRAVGKLFGGGSSKKSASSKALTGALPVPKPLVTATTTATKPVTTTAPAAAAAVAPVSTPTVVAPTTPTVVAPPTPVVPERVANDFVSSTPTVIDTTTIPETQTPATLESGDLTGSLKRKKRGYGVSSVLGF